jgi:HEPN domain-containing protein
MKQATQGWIDKAEDDLLLAQQSLATAAPVYDGICFHAQQCAEKYLKAVLQEEGVRFVRTHDLPTLAALANPFMPNLSALAADLAWLTTHAVDIRYPGVSATQAEATRALDIATRVRAEARASLGLAP